MGKTDTLLDTGVLIGLLHRKDQYHEWAKQQASHLEYPFFTCEAVLSEAFHLLEEVPRGSQRLLDLLERRLIQVPFSYTEHADRVHELMRTYADQPMSLADACLVRLAEERPAARVFTTDADFHAYRTSSGDAPDVLAPA